MGARRVDPWIWFPVTTFFGMTGVAWILFVFVSPYLGFYYVLAAGAFMEVVDRLIFPGLEG